MTITFVKKIRHDGTPCPKCLDVEARLDAGAHWHAIDRVVVADERDPDSEGIQLAARLGIDRAPFFIVENNEETIVYTVFFRFLKEVLQAPTTAAEDAEALLHAHPELDAL